MRQQNEYRVINEDIAALRNIAWAIWQSDSDNKTARAAMNVTSSLLRELSTRTYVEIYAAIAHP